jgi:hypothetical protein
VFAIGLRRQFWQPAGLNMVKGQNIDLVAATLIQQSEHFIV